MLMSKQLHTGIVWVNTWMLRDLRTPFGGVKVSGVGREGGFEVLRFFTEAKNVCIKYQRMDKDIREKIIAVCNSKIEKKGEAVGLSFYAFFKNKNDNPKLLMEVAKWWIEKHELDHFEKAIKIRKMIQEGL